MNFLVASSETNLSTQKAKRQTVGNLAGVELERKLTMSSKRSLASISANVKLNTRHSPLTSPHVLVSERPSPFTRAEAIKREYAAQLDTLLIEYKHEIAASLSDSDFSPAYQLAEIDAYLARLGQVLRTHERETSERAAAAERVERGPAWVEQQSDS